MADTESLGEAGVALARRPGRAADAERRVRIPTITDPRGLDFAHLQAPEADRRDGRASRRARSRAFEALGVLMTNTCINYQTDPAAGARRASRHGRHRRRDLFQQRDGRAQQLRGRALRARRRPDRPHAALRLSSRRHRRGTRHFELPAPAARSRRLGRARRHRRQRDQQLLGGAGRLRHRERAQFGRAEALRRGAGELRLGRAVPHARRHAGGADTRRRLRRRRRSRADQRSAQADFRNFTGSMPRPGDKVDVVVFAAPQLSLLEMQNASPTCSTAGRCTPTRR